MRNIPKVQSRIVASVLFFVCLHIAALSQNATQPLVDETLVFGAVGKYIVVEAEHFYKQSQTSKRAWYINSPQHHPQVWPDHDTASFLNAGGLAYVEALPDLFHTDNDPIIEGDNLGSAGGSVAVLHYRVHFSQPGRYYLWTRLRSNDEEDNTTAAGVDNNWPPTSKTLQSPVNKKQWIWKSDNRISRNPWKIGRAALDISTAGVHDVQFSMREDGEEFDRFLLTTDSLYTLDTELGPPATIYSGKLPKPFLQAGPFVKPLHALVNPDGTVYGANVLYADTMNYISFEAENFYRQSKAQQRMWHLVAKNHIPFIGPDSDSTHLTNASNNAYLELLPDLRQKDEDAFHSPTSIRGKGGEAAVLSYMINFPAPGTWYVWVSGMNNDGDDNTIHAGLDNNWPESGKKMMFGGRQWKWSNTQRDTRAAIRIEVPARGRHEFMLSMREDGCEIDRILLTMDSNFKPADDAVYVEKIEKGVLQNWLDLRGKQMNTGFAYLQHDDEIIIEAESVPATDGWKYLVDSSGHSGAGYLEWQMPGQGIQAGNGFLRYHIRIAKAGKYQLLLRAKMKNPTNRPDTPDPDGNDVWVSIEPFSNNAFQKVAILGHPAGWSWNTNYDNKTHTVNPVVLSLIPGNYVIALSGRSEGYALDKLMLLPLKRNAYTDFNSLQLARYNQKPESKRVRMN